MLRRGTKKDCMFTSKYCFKSTPHVFEAVPLYFSDAQRNLTRSVITRCTLSKL